jgi:hypothetical protein
MLIVELKGFWELAAFSLLKIIRDYYLIPNPSRFGA